MTELQHLIYEQLLELYIYDLETEVLVEKLKNIPYQPPVQPVPHTPYPWEQPFPWPNTQPFYYGTPYKVTSLVGSVTKYSEEYDAFYDPDKNVWVDDKCSDKNCEYCVNRPERPLTGGTP